MTYYMMYGARSRPDAYPHIIYRAGKHGSVVEQYAFGRFFAACDKAGNFLRQQWIDEQLEKGLLWQLANGSKYHWDATASHVCEPDYLVGLTLQLAVPTVALEIIAGGDVIKAVKRHGVWPALALSEFEQTRKWYVAQKGVIQCVDSFFTMEADTSFFTRHPAAEKFFDNAAWDLSSEPRERSVLDIKTSEPEIKTRNWFQRVHSAAQSRLEGIGEEQAFNARREEREQKAKLRGLIDRLRELLARPTIELTPAEFREKMRLKREVGGHVS